MWPFKKAQPRRLEVRKSPQRVVGPWERLKASGAIGSLLLAGLFYAGAVLLDLWPPEPLTYRMGQYLPRDIYARVNFRVPSQRLLEEQLDKARNATPATFSLDEALLEEIVAELSALPDRLQAASQPADVDPELQKDFALEDPAALSSWQAYAQPDRKAEYARQLEQFVQELAATPIVRPEDLRRGAGPIWLAYRGVRDRRHVSDLISLDKPHDIQYELDRLLLRFDPKIRPSIRAYLLEIFNANRPLFRYDPEATEKDIQERIREINADPPTEIYSQGQRLVRQSRREGPDGREQVVGLGAAGLELLRYEHEAYLAEERQKTPWRTWGRIFGRAVILLALTGLLCAYVVAFHPQLLKNRWQSLAVTVILLLMLTLGKVTGQVLAWNPHTLVLPVMMTGTIIAIAYGLQLAFVTAAALSVLTAFQMRADLGLCIVLLAGATACIADLSEIRTRSKLLRAAAIGGGAVLMTIWANGAASATPWLFVLSDALWGVGFALLVGILAQAGLPLIEKVFGIATSMTLLEWCDASKPLLKRLALEAPGTYNHSLQLAAMCESAAEAIGARGLLARVGAYYHDIGKINKPDYFIENQGGQTSKHAKLSPAMSLLVIIGHVKDGLELAREYGLPKVLHEFVATHHGTTLLEYFYHAATQRRREVTEKAPEEIEFRYPGPKPHSKEAAILMLADAAESSVRAMSEPTPGRIENQVHTMVNRRLMDGQLDECQLTLSEVHRVETSLVRSLTSIYHARIAYPTPAAQTPSAAELQAQRKAQANGHHDAAGGEASQTTDPAPASRPDKSGEQPR